MKIIANTRNQSLSEHSFAIAEVACELLTLFKFKENIDDNFKSQNSLKKILRLSAYLHDIGKIDNNFQSFLTQKNKTIEADGVHINDKKDGEFSFNKYPRHNEISWALTEELLEEHIFKKLLGNNTRLKAVKYIVYWHHAKIQRENKEIYSNSRSILNTFFTSNPIDDFILKLKDYFKEIELLEQNYNYSFFPSDSIKEDFSKSEIRGIGIPLFKNNYSQIEEKIDVFYDHSIYFEEQEKTFLRSLIVTADRLISSLSQEDLFNHIQDKTLSSLAALAFNDINSDIKTNLEMMVEKFDTQALDNSINKERNKKQLETAVSLSKIKDVSILSGPAGCGKTKIFLQWALEKSKDSHINQIFIVAPRNLICKGLYDEIKKDYLPNATIEINTGEFKLKSSSDGQDLVLNENEGFNSDVVITTIDQIVGVMLSHNKIDLMLKILKSHLIFDEFHEFFNLSGIVLLVKEIILLKSLFHDSNTLLVSATPNPFFIDFLSLKRQNIINIDTFNKEDYVFDFITDSSEKYGKMYEKADDEEIRIFNTATHAQLSSILASIKYQEKTITYHSKYTQKDKIYLNTKVMKNWGKNRVKHHQVLRAGPIVQASLNITSNKVTTQSCSAESWCQRLGRANRFAEDMIANFVTIKDCPSQKKNEGNSMFLDRINMYQQACSWIDFISSNLNKTHKLKTIYSLYSDYHGLQSTKDSYKLDFVKVLDASRKLFHEKKLEPVEYFKITPSKKIKLSSGGLRGSSIYILPIKVSSNGHTDWLYLPSTNDKQELLSLSDENDSTLLEIASQQKEKNPYKLFISSGFTQYKPKTSIYRILSDARFSDTPLLVSYKGLMGYYFYREINDINIGLLEENKFKEISDFIKGEKEDED